MSLQTVYAIDSLRESIGDMLAGFDPVIDTARFGVRDIARPCLTCREIFVTNFGRLSELQSEHVVFMHEFDQWWEQYADQCIENGIDLDMNLLDGSEICMPSNGL